MKYFVKTRNWHCKKWVFDLLTKTEKFGVVRGDQYTDNDGKFCLETNNIFKAVSIFLYFSLLKHFSGGWTYIVRTNSVFNGFCGDCNKSIFWYYKPL